MLEKHCGRAQKCKGILCEQTTTMRAKSHMVNGTIAVVKYHITTVALLPWGSP
jgi:hypothetical protein